MYKITVDCATQEEVIDLLVAHDHAKKTRLASNSHQQAGHQVANGHQPAAQQITHQSHQASAPAQQQQQAPNGNPNVYGSGQPTHTPHTIASDRISLPLQSVHTSNGNVAMGYNPQGNPYGSSQEQHHFTPPAAQFHDPNAPQQQPNGQPAYQQQPAQPGPYGNGNGASPGPNHAAPGGLTWADVAGLQKEIITSGRANAGAVFQIMQKYGGSLSGDPAPQHFAEIIREMKQLAGMA